jgi:hypothetical protein
MGISLAIKVKTIVAKLDALKMGEALKFYSEFLSEVHCGLIIRRIQTTGMTL